LTAYALQLAGELLDLLPDDGASLVAPLAEGYAAFRAMLGPDQLALIDDQAPLVAADPGRRAGKTTAFIGKCLEIATDGGFSAICYFAPSDEQGVDIVWEDMRTYNREFELGFSEHWSDRWWVRGDCRIEILGFNTRRDVERARGRKYRLVWLDEAQLAPEWFESVVESAIMPTTLDYRGQLYTTGTPSPVASGFFFEACHGRKWSHDHHWTAAQNPFFIRQGRDPLAEARERYHLDAESVTYRREWLGEWIVDPDALVYYIPPAAITAPPPAFYGYVHGLDLGWRDMDAIATIGVDSLRQRSHLIQVEGKSQQTNHELFARLIDLQKRYPGPVVYDPAGHATKKTIETFRVDAPQITWVQAEKTRKVEFIQLLNDDLRAGKTTVEPGSDMIREAKRLQWKRPGQLATDADHSDLGDAWLYPWRHARDWLRELPLKALPKAKLDPFEEEAALLEANKGLNYYRRRAREVFR
jgi:hypothetical protein